MYAPEFRYYRAGSVREACELLRAHPGAKLLAGGHSLIPLLKLRLASPVALVDIGRIADLRGISANGGAVRIGALTPHVDLASSAALATHCPALAQAAALVGDPAVRNRGTIGGNVAHADPASDLPTVLVALNARFLVAGPGGDRAVEAGQFFQGVMTTALGEHEVLTAIEVPVKMANQGMAYVKFDHPASRFAVIGVAAVLGVTRGRCSSAAVAIGGLVSRPVRAATVERSLVGQALSADTIAQVAGQVTGDLGTDILGDLYASADYRRSVAWVWVKRALTEAASRSS